MTRSLVEAKTLSRTFQRGSTEVVALEDVTLDIPEGDFLALMGPSGSGKTTLLNIIAGLDKPTSGALRVGDAEVHRMSESELAAWRSHHVGFVFQTFNLIPVLTAAENVELPHVARLSFGRRLRLERDGLAADGFFPLVSTSPVVSSLAAASESLVALHLVGECRLAHTRVFHRVAHTRLSAPL